MTALAVRRSHDQPLPLLNVAVLSRSNCKTWREAFLQHSCICYYNNCLHLHDCITINYTHERLKMKAPAAGPSVGGAKAT